MFLRYFLLPLTISMAISCTAQKQKAKTSVSTTNGTSASGILTGADQPERYLPLLKGKTIAVFANQTSIKGNGHIVDFLQKNGVKISVIFGPEHGFRGNAPDGAKIETATDAATGIPVVSLYGKKNKPSPDDLKGVDLMVYDIQDVGARFYTYISSLQYYLEAAIENNIPLLILDRPNPNGFYVDGPVLDTAFKSFVGMQPIPVAYGMTIGEYAQMLLNEGWLSATANKAYQRIIASRYRAGARFFQLQVIPCAHYDHTSTYRLPVRPSPNLPDMSSIYWYPSTCLFEGTIISEGRGTPAPFAIIGHPDLPKTLYAFTPDSTEGAPRPKFKGQVCYGWNLTGTAEQVLSKVQHKMQLGYLLQAYQLYPDKKNFFKENGFNRLAGNDQLIRQIREGQSEAQIRQSWEPALSRFKAIRKKYLLYADFE